MRATFMADFLAGWVIPSLLTAASAGVVHAIKWQFHHRYMTLETMTGLSDDPTGILPNYAIKAA